MWYMTVDMEDGRPALRRRKSLGKVPLGDYPWSGHSPQPDAAKQVRLVLEKVPAAIGADEPGRP